MITKLAVAYVAGAEKEVIKHFSQCKQRGDMVWHLITGRNERLEIP